MSKKSSKRPLATNIEFFSVPGSPEKYRKCNKPDLVASGYLFVIIRHVICDFKFYHVIDVYYMKIFHILASSKLFLAWFLSSPQLFLAWFLSSYRSKLLFTLRKIYWSILFYIGPNYS